MKDDRPTFFTDTSWRSRPEVLFVRLKATISKLSTSITEHSEKLVALDAAMKEATEVRHKEKAENEETIADATAALEAVTLATKVLKEYYAKAAPAMLQQSPADDAPESAK